MKVYVVICEYRYEPEKEVSLFLQREEALAFIQEMTPTDGSGVEMFSDDEYGQMFSHDVIVTFTTSDLPK